RVSSGFRNRRLGFAVTQRRSTRQLRQATMSLKPQKEFSAPGRAAWLWRRFRKGVPASASPIRGRLYRDKQFAALFPRRGQPAESPWRLALATALQLNGNVLAASYNRPPQ